MGKRRESVGRKGCKREKMRYQVKLRERQKEAVPVDAPYTHHN